MFFLSGLYTRATTIVRLACGILVRVGGSPEINQIKPSRLNSGLEQFRVLRVLFVISQDSGGGAARAVHRIYRSLRENFSDVCDVRMRVIHKFHDDDRIVGGKATRNRKEYFEYFVRTRFRKYFPRRPFVSDNTLLHSQALYHSGLGRELNQAYKDVIMLGWLGNSTLSIPEIGRLRGPVVWRLSDMWMFSGAEHYTKNDRYRVGYSRKSRPDSESGPDIDRETFRRKNRHWKYPRHVIAPSKWMAEQVKASQLTRKWLVHVIPNPIDCDYWAPIDRGVARAKMVLPPDAIVILFGTGGGLKHHHKGGDLLLASLSSIEKRLTEMGNKSRVICAIFGEETPAEIVSGIEVVYLGRLNDEELKAAYSAANVMVVPSRLDNLPSTAVEAQACGTPVVAFRVGGLPDIVDDSVSGTIVEPFDVVGLGRAIAEIAGDRKKAEIMGAAARERAIGLWSPRVIAGQYLEVLELAASEG